MCDAPTDLTKIKNVQSLLALYGEWPCFHDMAIESVLLGYGQSGKTVTLTVTFSGILYDFSFWDKDIGYRILGKDYITLLFTGNDFSISGFNCAAYIEGVEVSSIEPNSSGETLAVELIGGAGFCANFTCSEIEVVRAERVLTDSVA